MGRVETRMYKQKRRRVKTLRAAVLLLLLGAAAMIAWGRTSGSFVAEHIGTPSPTPVTSSFDQTVESREVTLAEETWYAIQTGVFSTEEAALQKADAYTDRGAPGLVVTQGGKWRVFIACYAGEEEAASVRSRLESNQSVETYLYAWECPELRLRLTGMVGQLDVVEAGFTLLISSAAALRDAAIDLDAGQLTTSEATKAVHAMADQFDLWKETARSRFGNTIPAMVEGMTSLLESWSASFEPLLSADTATDLSAALKLQAMRMFNDVISWRSDLAAQ